MWHGPQILSQRSQRSLPEYSKIGKCLFWVVWDFRGDPFFARLKLFSGRIFWTLSTDSLITEGYRVQEEMQTELMSSFCAVRDGSGTIKFANVLFDPVLKTLACTIPPCILPLWVLDIDNHYLWLKCISTLIKNTGRKVVL